jgi:eukaryotic-like serine/threonine-protein kinase
MIGKTLGHYRIGEQLGRGGMGEVYVAEDLSLDRKVALKFLPDIFTGDPERMARFEREAKLLASFNHPNIAAIHGFEQAEGKLFLILELVEGETLAQKLKKGPLSIDEASGVCRQIVVALEAAHNKGIIHRDLKPANVMITAGEKVKILDFGLAKALSDEAEAVDSSLSPTITEAMTRPGVILGTAAYMSPEQAKGKSADRRADIWAFGCILYECLTGKRAFGGETVTETLASILKGEPEWQTLPASTPANLRLILHRCLERDASRRLQNATDVRIVMEEERDISEHSAPAKRRWYVWGAAALFFLAAVTLAFIHFGENRPAPQVMRFKLNMVAVDTFSLSPDGRLLAYIAPNSDGVLRLWVRELGSLEARALPGIEATISSPFWSPDSRFIAFGSGGKLKKVGISGDPPQTLCDVPGGQFYGGSWQQDGVIIIASTAAGGGLMRISAAGGTASQVTKLNPARQELAHIRPMFLPDGKHFMYFVFSTKAENCGVFVGSLDSKSEEQESRRIPIIGSVPIYLAPKETRLAQVLFVRDTTLVAQRFDDDHIELVGEPEPVADLVGSYSLLGQTIGMFTASPNGVLIYVDSSRAVTMRELLWVDRQGKKIQSAAVSGSYNNFRLSGDEKKIVYDADSASDIWVLDLVRGVPSRLTFDPAIDNLPIWSPDGLNVLFPSNRNGLFDLYLKNATGAGQEQILIKLGTPTGWATDWSRDNRYVIYQIPGTKTGQDLWITPQFGDRKPFPYLQSEFNEQAGVFSPDGRWIAYVSNESGRDEIYVQSFPLSGSKFQISTGGGSEPSWRKNGAELFYVAADRNLMTAPIKFSPAFAPGLPQKLFSVSAVAHGYAASADGQRFLVLSPPEQQAPASYTLVMNWQAALKNR